MHSCKYVLVADCKACGRFLSITAKKAYCYKDQTKYGTADLMCYRKKISYLSLSQWQTNHSAKSISFNILIMTLKVETQHEENIGIHY